MSIKVRIPKKYLRKVTLRRFVDGSYVSGVWQEGTPTVTPGVRMSVQPVSPSDYRLLPEGASPQLSVEIFYKGVFQMGFNGQQPDEVIDGSVTYRCLFIKPWTHNGYNSAIFMSTEENPYS